MAAKHQKLNLVKDYLLILAGTLTLAFGYSCFVTPNDIVPGGVYGITIIIHHLTKGVFSYFPDGLPVGLTALFFNIPFMILAAKMIGMKSGMRTIFAFVSLSLLTDMFTGITGGKALVPDQPLLNCFYGGALLGIGVALVFYGKATCAGTDLIAKLLAERTHIKVNTMVILIDSAIVMGGMAAFGNLMVPLLSWLTIFIYSKFINVLERENPYKTVVIVTTKPEDVRAVMIGELNIGGNYLYGEGLYSHERRNIILALVKRGKIFKLREEVEKIDNNVFFIVMDSTRESFWLSPDQQKFTFD
ncbi:MAG: YitT family protein [Bacteroidales bacterium]|nr:YitT family protein [Bacteroidales bacterium]